MEQTVVVLGSPEPVTLGESARSVVAMDPQAHPLALQTTEDYLRTDSSVDIQQRGAAGVQSDISIRGASFEQTLVLLNGLRVNDAQTSHFNLDVPVPVEAMGAIDVLHGAGSTLYGSDALGGVVDFVTVKPAASSLSLRSGAGSFGENEQTFVASGTGSLRGHDASEVLAGERYFSDGFIYDRDYRTEDASSESRISSALGMTDILLAGSDRAYGANQFYGNYDSWERTKGWFASLQQQLGANTSAALGYRRHSDEFILLREDPAAYENNHIDQSWEGALRRVQPLFKLGDVYYGLEEDTDAIHSNNLGDHGRNRGAGYVDVDLRAAQRGTFSAGAREEILSGGRAVFSPMLAASWFAASGIKLRASAGNGFRLPTFTDLYYSDPSTLGNPNLKPEAAWNFDGGADWYINTRAAASVTVFYSRQHDTIDYVRASSSDPWQASNLSGVRFAGVESSMQWRPQGQQQVKLAWTLLSGAQSALHGLQSEYIFNYPVNNASAEWSDSLARGIFVRTRVGVTQRYEQEAYPVWDISVAREAGRVRPYLRATNLSNTGYQEIAGVTMPGRAFVGGVQIFLAHAKPAR
jgi:iron complex outermembrane receptor protein